MTETLRRPLKNDVDARVARFLAAEEEKHKAEKKEAIRALVEPAGLVVVALVITAVAVPLYSQVLDDSFVNSPAKIATGTIEKWAVSHPSQQVLTTNEYVSYRSYFQRINDNGQQNSSVEDNEPYIEDSEELMLKVVKSDGVETNVGFTVCAYLEGVGGETVYSFDSVTGEGAVNKITACS